MATRDLDPLSGNDIDDATKPSLTQSPEPEFSIEQRTSEAHYPVPQHLDNPVVHTSAQAQERSKLQRAEREGMDEVDAEVGISENVENDAQPEGAVVDESNDSEVFDEEVILSDEPPDIPYALQVSLSEHLLAFRRSVQDPESFRTWSYEMHRLLARPSPESPLERFLTPTWVEDANNLYARMHIEDLDVPWDGLSIAETRQAIARALVRHTTRNAMGASSSHPTGNVEQELPFNDEQARESTNSPSSDHT